jgi:hypothetical protein
MRIRLGSCPASASGRWLVAAPGAPSLESGYTGPVAGAGANFRHSVGRKCPPDTSQSPGSFADAARLNPSGRRLTEERMSP